MKLCINCKHHQHFEDEYGAGAHQCFRNVSYATHPVTGFVSHSDPEICDHERAKEEPLHCGFGGQYHEVRKPWWRFWK